MPLYSSLLEITEGLARNVGADVSKIDDAREYYLELLALRPEKKQDIEKAILLRKKFLSEHPFSDLVDGPRD
jgi:hypothetical protein